MTIAVPAADAAQPVIYVIDADCPVWAALEDLLASVGVQVRTFGSTQEFLGAKTADGHLDRSAITRHAPVASYRPDIGPRPRGLIYTFV